MEGPSRPTARAGRSPDPQLQAAPGGSGPDPQSPYPASPEWRWQTAFLQERATPPHFVVLFLLLFGVFCRIEITLLDAECWLSGHSGKKKGKFSEAVSVHSSADPADCLAILPCKRQN